MDEGSKIGEFDNVNGLLKQICCKFGFGPRVSSKKTCDRR